MLRFVDGFDHYSTPYSSNVGKWQGVHSITGTPGRYDRGRYIIVGTGGLTHEITGVPVDGIVLGFAVKMADGQFFRGGFSSDRTILDLYNDVTIIASVVVDPSGTSFTVNGTTINYEIPRGGWWHLQIKLADTASGVKINNGTTIGVANLTDTVTSFRIRSMSDANINNWLMDDFYFCDTEGATFNDFLGDVSIRTAYPNIAGSENDFAPSIGASTPTNRANMVNRPITDFINVSEYNISGPDNVDDRDLYVTSYTPQGTLLAIQNNLIVRKDSLDLRTGAHVIRFNGTDYEGPNFNLNTVWSHASKVITTDPAGGSLEWADLLNCEFGLKVAT